MISQVTDIYESIAQRTDGNIYIVSILRNEFKSEAKRLRKTSE